MSMQGHAASSPNRRPTNISLSEDLVAEAKSLGVNLSRACEAGLATAVRAERERRWKAENREAMESWGEALERHGLPLARHRSF
jgi:antitoxin CcdA